MKYVGDRITRLKRREALDDYVITLPQYHRAAVGLIRGTRYYIVEDPANREIIVSSINPRRWGDLWKFEVNLIDRPGSVERVLQSISTNQVNILALESLSEAHSEAGLKTHRLSLILDLKLYSSKIDGNTDDRNTVDNPDARPNSLINKILYKISDIIIHERGRRRWDFSFERMKFFFDNKHRRGRRHTRVVGQNTITVPNNVIFDIIANNPDSVPCHVISDTEEKYLKIVCLSSVRKYMLLDIEHLDAPGAIHNFCEAIAARGFNILNSYSRLEDMAHIAIFYVFLELKRETRRKKIFDFLFEIEALDHVQSFSILSSYGFGRNFYKEIKKFTKDGGQQFYKIRETRAAPKRDESIQFAETIDSATMLEAERLKLKPIWIGRSIELQERKAFVAIPFVEKNEWLFEDYIEKTPASSRV